MRGRRMRFPIGVKILSGQVTLILVFLAAQGIVFWAAGLPLFSKFAEVYHEATAEAVPFSRLQGEMVYASFRLNRHAVDSRAEDRLEFHHAVDKVNAMFSSLEGVHFGEAEERELLQAAKEHWDDACGTGLRLAFAEPGSLETIPMLQEFNEHLIDAIGLIDRLNDITATEMEQSWGEVEKLLKKGLALFVVALAICIAAATFLGFLMWRGIVRPLRLLTSGAEAISAAEWGQPIGWQSRDEFADLAQSFNAMAASLSSQRKTLEDLAYQDALTGVLTRRAILSQCNEELERARRYNHVCSVAMIDVDNFKSINDAYGHPAGDEVLRQVAERLSRTLRGTDRIGRYGGEEFMVMLPETDEGSAAAITERLRQLVGATAIILADGREIAVTFSAGVATFPADASALDTLIRQADLALYAAKQNGRNRVCLAWRSETRGGKRLGGPPRPV